MNFYEKGIEVRLMQPQDAPGVVDLYKAVYGDEYPVKTVYDPENIVQQLEKGDMYRIIALHEGRIVGQTAVYRSTSSNLDLYEMGQGVVLPDYRNQGIVERCMSCGFEEVCPRLNISQIWGEAVCNHIYMQKLCARMNFVETAIELDLMPASSYVKEQSSQGRVTTLSVFHLKPLLNQIIYLPEFYQDALRYLYSVYDFKPQFIFSHASLPDQSTRGYEEIYADAGIARYTLLEAGQDLENYLIQQEKEALSQGCYVFQAYLNLASPSVGHAVNILRNHQYFLGGVLPRWFKTDGLLMQKLLHEPYLDGIKLYSERARKILNMIIDDRSTII